MSYIARAYGDSVTQGGFADTWQHAYAYLFATSRGWDTSILNCARGMRFVADFLGRTDSYGDDNYLNKFGVFWYNPSTTERYMTQLATNNAVRGDGISSSVSYGKSAAALLAYLSMTNDAKVRAVNAISETGTWATSSYYNGFVGAWGRYTTTDGSTSTFQITGDILYLSTWASSASSGASISISIDGNYKQTVNCYGGLSGIDVTYTQFLTRISGLGDGTHTVVLEAICPSNARAEWEWGAGLPYATNKCHVWVGNEFYLTYGGVTNLNSELASWVNTLFSDGLRIYLVDIYNTLDYPADYHAPDYYHPNTVGHAKIAAAFEAIPEVSTSVDVNISLDLTNFANNLCPIENVGTWGIDIDITDFLANYSSPDGNGANLIPSIITPPTEYAVNFSLGNGLMFPKFNLRTDWIHQAFENLFDCAVAGQNLTPLITPYYYSPPEGSSVNFFPIVSTPPEWDKINWQWPEHFIGELETYNIDQAFNELESIVLAMLRQAEVRGRIQRTMTVYL